jgi:hypothetical protein
LVSTLPLFSQPVSATTLGDLIAERDDKHIGIPIKGFDSADFVSYVYNKEYYPVPSNIRKLAKEDGELVSKPNLETGVP